MTSREDPLLALRPFAQVMDRLAAAFAVIQGRDHTLAYANSAFRKLLPRGDSIALGEQMGNVVAPRDATRLLPLLERALRTGIALRDCRIDAPGLTDFPLTCSIWPAVSDTGDTDHLLVELRPATKAEISLTLQREVAERLLVSALRELRLAESADASRLTAEYLAAETSRLGESLEEGATMGAIQHTTLPGLEAWCIVDILAPDHTMHRLTAVHPDPEKQAVLAALDGQWAPEVTDQFGLPAILRETGLTAVTLDLEAALQSSERYPHVIATVRALDSGQSLTVPMLSGDRLIGALTFVARRDARRFGEDDVELARALAGRSANALERARLYSESVALRLRAESASQAKSTFLGMMSHELRTPLNAIGGYVDLIDMELRGPVTEAQHVDLARIRTNQKYLAGLINDLLNLTKLDGGMIVYNTRNLLAAEVLKASRLLVDPLITQRRIGYDDTAADSALVVRGDRDRVVQILVNLLSNAIKFTAPGGMIQVACSGSESTVSFQVSDTGIGIPEDKLEEIFSPFVQIDGGSVEAQAGVGLGLAISRGLARAMHGDLIAQSAPGQGARFILTLPRAASTIVASAADAP